MRRQGNREFLEDTGSGKQNKSSRKLDNKLKSGYTEEALDSEAVNL
jgi:hypothetical protein